ncbi:MAG: serine--tRNA ligase [Thermoplasmatales archaeon]|jgi:seryl-tRNA synthetase|nr:serine--tRNA ligase [Thermoplasmatales archaeon]
MLDINLIRNNPEVVRENQKKRNLDPADVDKILELDRIWRENLQVLERLRNLKNRKVLEISSKLKKGEDASSEKDEVKKLNDDIERVENIVEEVKRKRDSLLWKMPNILDEDVPYGKDENDNVPFRFWGRAKVFREDLDNFLRDSKGSMEYEIIEDRPLSHTDLIEKYDLADTLRAGKVAGSRFYYLKRDLVKLELALEMFALDHLVEKGFIPVEPPFMLTRRAMEGATDLSSFEETIYKVENEDLYLIATSEHPLAAYHMDEIIEENSLPLKYAGISPCFRKEAGAHGKDTKGIFRVHQFNKVEQFIYCHPEESRKFHEEILRNAEEIYQKLELPYRVINICSGDIGNVASKKYDIEVWMPAQGKFREVVSASNVKDYQARRLNIRVRGRYGNYYPHTLNSTAVATTRTMVAIIENHQDGDGIRIPDPLVKYFGKDFIKIK